MNIEEFTVIIPPSELPQVVGTHTARVLAVTPHKDSLIVKGFATVYFPSEYSANMHLPKACLTYGYTGSTLINSLKRYRSIRKELLTA